MTATPWKRWVCAAMLGIAGSVFTRAADVLAERSGLFDYDATAGFALVARGTESRGGADVVDLSFEAAPGTRTDAYLVTPVNATRSAGILWVHWLGEPETTNRTEFLDEAVALAARGATSLLVDAMWAKPHWYRERVLEEDFANSVRQVIALRRALDLLRARPGVDAARIGFVGHDYGAMYGTIAVALDGRVKTAVLLAATPSFSDWAFFANKPASMDDYLRQNAPLEIRDFLGAVRHTEIFMQFAENDEYVSLERAEAFHAAAGGPKRRVIYAGAGHDMTKPAAIREDRTTWLVEQLGLE